MSTLATIIRIRHIIEAELSKLGITTVRVVTNHKGTSTDLTVEDDSEEYIITIRKAEG